MKKTLIVFLFLPLILYGGFITVRHFWRGELMPEKKVCTRWGNSSFDEKKFKAGTDTDRANMTCDLLKNKSRFLGLDRAEIRSQLGTHTGHYFSEMYPAYMIETATDRSQDSWQIVFFIDKDEKISDVAVHKNCCDR
jgi:hypothetical protein